MQYFKICSFLLVLLSFGCGNNEIELKEGMTIKHSVTIKPGIYNLNGSDDLTKPVITIEGKNIVIDFNGAILEGAKKFDQPNEFQGLGILIKNAENVKIKNAIVKGFKIGLMAEGVDSLKIEDSNFSYNYRQKLKSGFEKENIDDWMSYHHNENDEWLRYGAAIYLKNCNNAIVKNLIVTGGQNGLMMTNCNNGFFYNNNISYNSAIGIGLYRSSHNRVMHNKLDWNIRGFSFEKYHRGQDSAGILAYEQSSNNVFAYNSATHSGDGFFLWAGKSTMDSGKGGCNENIIAANDFSYASNNGIEITFSSNKVYNNILHGCDYGVWGGYSYQTILKGNNFKNNNYGIAIEHGNHNRIVGNRFENNQTGIQLWERNEQPEDWGFAKNRDVSSKAYNISYNLFTNCPNPLRIKSASNLLIDDNHFYGFDQLLVAEKENDSIQIIDNLIYQDTGFADAASQSQNNFIKTGYIEINLPATTESLPPKLKDGIEAYLPDDHLRGRKYILVNEWGPYNFQYPAIWLRNIKAGNYTFAIFGPEGNWKVVGGEGFKSFSIKTGTMPATLVAEADSTVQNQVIKLEFIGESFTTQFGDKNEKGKVFEFEWAINN
jgi:parallel beta-helix repeat protein